MRHELLQRTERWIAWVRLGGIPFAVVEVGLISQGYPPGYERRAWILTAIFSVGAVAIWLVARRDLSPRRLRLLGLSALALDTAVVAGFTILFFAFEPNTPIRQLLLFPVAEAAVRYGIAGGVALPFLLLPALAFGEWLRTDRLPPDDFNPDALTFPFGVQLLMGLTIGWLVARLRHETAIASTRRAVRSPPRSTRRRRSTRSCGR